MSEMKPEDREKLLTALEKGNVNWSEHGTEYWRRAGVIDMENPDFTVVKAEADFWGSWHTKCLDGSQLGNQGGVEICWQSVSAGFGSLTIHLADDGTIGAETQGMGQQFCNEVLAKLDPEDQHRCMELFEMDIANLAASWKVTP